MWLSYDGVRYETWLNEPLNTGDCFRGRDGELPTAAGYLVGNDRWPITEYPDMEPMTCAELESIIFKVKE